MQDTNISESDFHLGRLIREELNRQKRSVTWLAEQINCDRTNCYLIFEKKYIDIPLLMRISCALNRNFIDDLAEYSRSVVKFTTTV
ncbi:MAG: XRE family transcriptional regulator [Bacteroidales bacterium]|nr:XRE family transcriptional regulator [Bacteroidales bacterium]